MTRKNKSQLNCFLKSAEIETQITKSYLSEA